MNALKSRSNTRKVKARSNGLFCPQVEVAKTTTQELEQVNSNDAALLELPTREEMFKQMMVMQEQMAQMQSKLGAKSSSSNGGSKAPVVRDVRELVEN